MHIIILLNYNISVLQYMNLCTSPLMYLFGVFLTLNLIYTAYRHIEAERQ